MILINKILRKSVVNPFSNANKNLMNLENYNPDGSRTEAQMTKETTRLEETLEGLRQEKGFLEKEIIKEKNRFESKDAGADFTGEAEKDRQKQKQQQEEQQKQERIDQEGLKIGSLNINNLDKKVRYGIGLGLIGICAFILYWIMKQLSKPKDKFGKKK